MAEPARIPHFPRPVAIDGYGRGGFRFANMSHRGSLLCLPSGIWAWPIAAPEELTETSFDRVFANGDCLSLFLLGTGSAPYIVSGGIQRRFRENGIALEIMRTGLAANTYNILLGEGRQAGAGLIAVD